MAPIQRQERKTGSSIRITGSETGQDAQIFSKLVRDAPLREEQFKLRHTNETIQTMFI